MRTNRPAKIRDGQIDLLHASLAEGIKGILGARVTIRPNLKWKSSDFRGQLSFDLWPTNRIEFAYSRGRNVGVIAIPRNEGGQDDKDKDPCAWVTWYEEWLKRPDDSFSLLTAAWTVFWGIPGDHQKAQVLRAEWDQKHDVPANPHWHIDPTLQVSPVTGGPPVSFEALRPFPPSAGAAVAGRGLPIDRAHLGMGGWEHQSLSPWRHPPLDNTEQLCRWAMRTLEHLTSQCKDFQST